MSVYDTIYLEYGTGSLILGADAPLANPNMYGGVQLKVMTDSFEESDPKYIGDFESYNLYDTVKGKFKLRLHGPTATGVLYFYDLLQDYAKIPERFVREQTPFPLILHIGTVNNAVLTSMDVTAWDKQLQLNDLSTMLIDVEYERLPLIGGTLSYPSLEFNPFSDYTTPIRYPIVTSGNMGFIPSPVQLQMGLGRMKTVFPSGYFLGSNWEITTISGGLFYRTSTNPGSPRQTIINDNANNPFSTYDGVQNNFGVLLTTPTQLNTNIVSSGIVYGNGRTTSDAFNLGQNDYDVYITYKTTFSGTLFDFNLKANYLFYANAGKQIETGYRRLPHSNNPAIAYIGRISGDYSIGLARLQMDIKPTGTISGALLVDRVVLHPVQELYNSVKVSKLDLTSIDPGNPDTATTSGIMVAEFLSSYMNNALQVRVPRASLRVFRYGLASKTPSYQGNIDLYTKKWDGLFPMSSLGTKYDRGYYNMLFLATGSAYDTVSGMRYWILSDSFNQEVKTKGSIITTEMRTNV